MELTNQQTDHLQKELRKGANVQVYRRAAALLAVHQGRAISQVSALLGVTRQTIYNWLSNHGQGERALNLADAPRSGRPSVWTEDLDTLVTETLQSPPNLFGFAGTGWTIQLLQKRIEDCNGTRMSVETIRRHLRRLGYVWKRGGYLPKPGLQPAGPRKQGLESPEAFASHQISSIAPSASMAT